MFLNFTALCFTALRGRRGGRLGRLFVVAFEIFREEFDQLVGDVILFAEHQSGAGALEGRNVQTITRTRRYDRRRVDRRYGIHNVERQIVARNRNEDDARAPDSRLTQDVVVRAVPRYGRNTVLIERLKVDRNMGLGVELCSVRQDIEPCVER